MTDAASTVIGLALTIAVIPIGGAILVNRALRKVLCRPCDLHDVRDCAECRARAHD